MTLHSLIHRLISVPLVGVDVGSSWLKVVELALVGGQPTLRHCALAPLERQAPAEVLKRVLAEHQITTTRAALALASPQAIVKPFEFPPMPKKELGEAIRLEAEQAILNGHALSEMAVDWHPLLPGARSAVRGVLSVVPKTIVASRVGVAKAAALCPSVVDLEGLALWNAYWALIGAQEPAPRTVLLVNVGVQTTNLVIATGPDALILVRDLQLGGEAVAAGRGNDWLAEVRDSLSYARAQGGLRSLEAVYVTGGGSGPGLLPLLRSAVSVPVTFWNPLQGIARDAASPPVEPSAGPLLAIAIGLALRQ